MRRSRSPTTNLFFGVLVLLVMCIAVAYIRRQLDDLPEKNCNRITDTTDSAEVAERGEAKLGVGMLGIHAAETESFTGDPA